MILKTHLKFLIVCSGLCIQGCSPLGKPVSPEVSDSFYYNKSKTDIIYSPMGNWFELGKQELNADAASFKALNKQIGKDQDHAYYQSHKIDHADLDLKSFRAKPTPWMWHIGMDDNQVYAFRKDIKDGAYYLITLVIENADPETFIKTDFNWAKDKQTHFYRHQPLEVDHDSFRPINNYFALDNNKAYYYFLDRFEAFDANVSSFQKVNEIYVRDDQNLYLFLDYLKREKVGKLLALPYSDFKAVEFYDENHLRISHRVYYRGQLIDGINPDQVEVAGPEYIKDQQHVFYEGDLLAGADAPTFRYDEAVYSYRDEKNFYREGKPMSRDREEAGMAKTRCSMRDDVKQENMTSTNPNAFQVIISLDKESYQKGEAIVLSMVVENISETKDSFCSYHTPFEGIQNNIFSVLRENKEIIYQGMVKKRIPPGKNDFIYLSPGESSGCKVTLDGYDIDRKGSYRIQFSGNMISGLPASNTERFIVK